MKEKTLLSLREEQLPFLLKQRPAGCCSGSSAKSLRPEQREESSR